MTSCELLRRSGARVVPAVHKRVAEESSLSEQCNEPIFAADTELAGRERPKSEPANRVSQLVPSARHQKLRHFRPLLF